jgi:hypothetical protein
VARRIESWRTPDYLATKPVSLPTGNLQHAPAQRHYAHVSVKLGQESN